MKTEIETIFVLTTEMAFAVIPHCPLQITLMSVNPRFRDKKPVQEVLNK
jgi:pentose-5-phosphate-3-epimerase